MPAAPCSRLTLILVSVAFNLARASEQDPPAKQIQDNSFLVEEAYNQEAGVVQHIFNAQRYATGDDSEWDLAFTQEWPLFSQQHQLSYTVPYSFVDSGGQSNNGFGDVLLNYRFQAVFETETKPAFAPRFSLVLPTGDADEGFGNDTVGFQLNLPVSKIVSDRWTVHGNAGLTILPEVDGHDLVNCNLGASAIYAVNSTLNLMLECVANRDEEVDAGRIRESWTALISPGFRYAFNHPNGAQTVVGVAVPVGLTDDSPDYGVFLYVSFEHAFVKSVVAVDPRSAGK